MTPSQDSRWRPPLVLVCLIGVSIIFGIMAFGFWVSPELHLDDPPRRVIVLWTLAAAGFCFRAWQIRRRSRIETERG